MNDVKDEAGARSKRFPLNLFLVIGAIVVLTAGGLLFFTQASSSAGCVDKGPCMLYFYADW